MSEWQTKPGGRAAIVGSGQAAWAWGLGLQNAGIQINQVWARHAGRGKALANRLDAEYQWFSNVTPASWDGDVLLIAVADQAVEKVAAQFLCGPSQHIVHCGGTLSMDVLAMHPSYGVLWPLMNLSQAHENLLHGVPILYETNNQALHQILQAWCQDLHALALPSTHAQRNSIHLAAVMTANFNNLLLHWGHRSLQGHGEHRLLLPILQQQLQQFAEDPADPLARQSGPAHRGDTETMDKHLALLEHDPEGQALYRTLSRLIAQLKSKPGHD